MKLSFLICVICVITGCAHPSLDKKMRHYAAQSRQQLTENFTKAGLTYPPKQLAFLIFKDNKRFEMYARNSGAWRYIRTYPILAASGHPGPKLQEGDRQVPEGIYHIAELNPRSHFDLSMQLDYPNDFDEVEAQADHRSNLGGNIFIHGNRLSVGCIAVGNKAIQQLFPLVALVGKDNVRVIIAPDDLRAKQPIYTRHDPKWTPQLYENIKLALRPFALI